MNKIWSDEAWEDYLYWHMQDRKTLKRVNQLAKDIESNGNSGIGKPEPLKYQLRECWSRRIDAINRLVYFIGDGQITILQC